MSTSPTSATNQSRPAASKQESTRVDHFDVVIVGAGFNGLYQLHRLRQRGFAVRLVEATPGLGGVWQANRYPGARVDSHVPNYEYSLEEIWRGWTWTEKFPGRDELVAYFDHVDAVLDLRRDIDLNTRISSGTWHPDDAQWELTAENGRRYRAQFVIMCTGFGSKPFIPDITGLESFGGEWYHTARWPDPHGENPVSFDGKRVGVIGTGASGVQVVQEAARTASHLVVFQRSPVTALPMEQRQLDADEQDAAKAGYPEMFRRRNAPPGSFHDIGRLSMKATEVDDERRREVFEEAWQKGGFHFWVGTFADILLDERANRLAYEFWRDKTRARINDPGLAEVLAPTDPPYPFGTKRPSLEQGYYECFNQPNVELVDIAADPIEAITSSGVQTQQRRIDLDLIVLATGFDANTGGLTSIDLRGDTGQSLAEQWNDGVDTYLGIAIPGFTNFLMLYGPQSATAFCNGPVCAEIQGDWIVELLEHMRTNELVTVTTSAGAATEWSGELAAMADSTLFGQADSWYMGANVPGKRRQLLNFPSSDAYLKHLATSAKAGYPRLIFSPNSAPAPE